MSQLAADARPRPPACRRSRRIETDRAKVIRPFHPEHFATTEASPCRSSSHFRSHPTAKAPSPTLPLPPLAAIVSKRHALERGQRGRSLPAPRLQRAVSPEAP